LLSHSTTENKLTRKVSNRHDVTKYGKSPYETKVKINIKETARFVILHFQEYISMLAVELK
jgi:predicted AlkP superfamily phosphohydrolase/phosphomutase